MVTERPRALCFGILLCALPAAGWAQDANAVLFAAAHTTGTENLRTLKYSAAGSIYDDKGNVGGVKSLDQSIDFRAGSWTTTRKGVTSGEPVTDFIATQTMTTATWWDEQFEYWITPFGFLKGAESNTVTLETNMQFGETYRVLTYTLPGDHRISAYVNAKDLIERVRLTLYGSFEAEGIYRDYADFGGLKMPTLMILRRGGALSSVLIVKDAKPNA